MEPLQSTTEIRHLGAGDSQALTRLAELDTASPLPAPVIGAIVDGRLLAAHSLETGEEIADPFSPTADLRGLLADWARTLRWRRSRVRRRRFVPGSEHTHLLQRPRGF